MRHLTKIIKLNRLLRDRKPIEKGEGLGNIPNTGR